MNEILNINQMLLLMIVLILKEQAEEVKSPILYKADAAKYCKMSKDEFTLYSDQGEFRSHMLRGHRIWLIPELYEDLQAR